MKVDTNIFDKMPDSFRATCLTCKTDDDFKMFGRIVCVLGGRELDIPKNVELFVEGIAEEFTLKNRKRFANG